MHTVKNCVNCNSNSVEIQYIMSMPNYGITQLTSHSTVEHNITFTVIK